jgi:superoxide reductase
MTELRELYRCEVCGNLIEIVNEGAPALVCCGQPMVKQEAKTADEGLEKHVPVVEETENGLIVKVGSVEHPMVEDHYIKFIEVLTKDKVFRAELAPGMSPQSGLCPRLKKEDIIEVREFCTKHGVWKG